MNAAQLSTVAQLVAERPSRAHFFESLKIDYFRAVAQSLEEASTAAGLDPARVTQQLEEFDAAHASDTDWRSASLSELCNYIERTHHAFLRDEFPRLSPLIKKVIALHASKHPDLRKLDRLFEELRREQELHLQKEERVLFPLCRRLDQSEPAAEAAPAVLANPVAVMQHEHDEADGELQAIRNLIEAHAALAKVCPHFGSLLTRIRALEADMHRHVHLENHVLFPRAVETEQKRR